MKLTDIKNLLNAEVLTRQGSLDQEVCSACGSDMMSDVLAYVKDQAVLLTGLVNSQAIRTAEMMDMRCVIFVRGKTPGEEIVKLADGCGIVVMTTRYRMYEACGILYLSGLCTKN